MDPLRALIAAASGFALAACQATDPMPRGLEALVPSVGTADVGEVVPARTSTALAGEQWQPTATARSVVNPRVRQEESEPPFFVEAIRTTSMGGSQPQHIPIHVGQAAFAYDPDGRILFVAPRKARPPTGVVLLIGETAVLSTPAQSYEQRNIAPYPEALPQLFHILSWDERTGNLRIQVADAIAELGPGQARTFKSRDRGTAQFITTVVTHHGRVSEIRELQAGDGLR